MIWATVTAPSDTDLTRPDPDWWRSSVTYQIYIRSFADANGDGVGDVNGIRSRLAYIASLGVDALWINPWYPSPQTDGGYDVADYRDIEPIFGTLADGHALISEAHAVGLRVLLDIVPNHTSDEHPWFRAALDAGPGSPERARYHFRPGKGDDGELPPNDWTSAFDGVAWTRTDRPDREWYLHLFDSKQPDVNWDNPDVRAEFTDILRFWFDAGVDGFRIDVAHAVLKADGLPDLGEEFKANVGGPPQPEHPHWDQPGVPDIYREWRDVGDSYDPPRVFVAEAWVSSVARLAEYLKPGRLHTAFDFHTTRCRWDAVQLRGAIAASLDAHQAVGAPVTWVLSNHDINRHVTRYGRDSTAHPLHGRPEDTVDLPLGTRRARAAILLELALPGAVYLYQGEELGLPEVDDIPEHLLADPTWERSGSHAPWPRRLSRAPAMDSHRDLVRLRRNDTVVATTVGLGCVVGGSGGSRPLVDAVAVSRHAARPPRPARVARRRVHVAGERRRRDRVQPWRSVRLCRQLRQRADRTATR